jgi:hypothetical protein
MPKPKFDLEALMTSCEFLQNCYPKNAWDLCPIDPKDHEDVLDELVDEGLLTLTRRAALMSGKPMRPSERKQLRSRILRRRFETPDADIVPAIFLCEAPAEFKGDRVLVILSRGYSFTGVTREIFGAFQNKEAALKALRKEYFLDSEDAS